MKKHANPHNLFFLACLVALLSFQFARGLTSISIALFFIAGVWTSIVDAEKRRMVFRSSIFIVCAAWFALLFVEGFMNVKYGALGKELMLKSGMVILPFSVIQHVDLSKRKTKWIMGSFVLSMAVSALISSVNYLLNMEEVNTLLLQSKHVPLVAKVHHIYFGLFLAVSIVVNYWLLKHSDKASKERKLWLIVLVLQFLSIHLLSSRTGLISFYAGVYLMSMLYLFRMEQLKHKLVMILALLALPFMAAILSPSLRHKVLNTKEDLEAVEKGGDDINYKSFAMRLEAWKMCIDLIGQHPFIGVGASNLEKEMAETYIKNKTVLYEENRVGPHSQVLESTVAHGILGGLLILLMLLVPFVFYRQQMSIYFIGIWAILGTAFLVESVLERQMGILLFGVFYVWSLYEWKSEKMVSD